jgi:hypothetical protein
VVRVYIVIVIITCRNATAKDDCATSFMCRVGFVTIATLCTILIVLEAEIGREVEQGALFPALVLTH